MIFRSPKVNEAFIRLVFITTFGIGLNIYQNYIDNKIDQRILKDIENKRIRDQ